MSKPFVFLAILITLSAAFAFAQLSERAPTDKATPPPLNCANSPEDWDLYIKNQILSDLGSTPMSMIYGKTEKATRQCQAEIARAGLGPCFDRIAKYSKQFVDGSGGMFSTHMSDADYYAMQPQEIMQLPPEFNNPPKALPENWKEICEKNGWKWVLFHSNTASEPRLIIHVPGEKYDRLLLYYYRTPEWEASSPKVNDNPTTYRAAQMQAIEKNPKDGAPPKYWFKSWGFKVGNKGAEPHFAGGRCVTCHLNGPRAIIPTQNPGFPTQLGGVKSLDEFNALIVQNKLLDYSPYYDLENFPTKMQLGKHDQCTECHDGNKRSSLAMSIDKSGSFRSANIHRKVVVEKSMPKQPWWEWTDEGRTKFVEYLTTEYETSLGDWLTETKCSSLTPPSGKQPRLSEPTSHQ